MPEPPIFDQGKVDQFIQRRVCSRCYGDLEKYPAPREKGWAKYYVRCPECGDAWRYTTVSRSYAEGLGQKALTEYNEVRYNLPELFPVKQRTKEECLHDLGF